VSFPSRTCTDSFLIFALTFCLFFVWIYLVNRYGVILEKFQKQDPSLIGRIRGCIVDSAPVAAPDPQVTCTLSSVTGSCSHAQ